MSEKFDDLNELEVSLESEVSDADIPKSKRWLASSVRTLIFLVVAAVGGASVNGCCTFRPEGKGGYDCRNISDKLEDLKKKWLGKLRVKKEGLQTDGNDVRFGEGGTKKDAIEAAKRKLELPEGKPVDLDIRVVQVRGKAPHIPVVVDTSVETETNAGNLIADCAQEKIGEWVGCGICGDLVTYALSETDVCEGSEVVFPDLRRGDIMHWDRVDDDNHIAIVEKVNLDGTGLIWHQNVGGSPVVLTKRNFTKKEILDSSGNLKETITFHRYQNSRRFLAMIYGKLDIEAIRQGLLDNLGVEKIGRQPDGSIVQKSNGKNREEAEKKAQKAVQEIAGEKIQLTFKSEAVKLSDEKWMVCVQGVPKPVASASLPVVAPADVTGLMSVEASKIDPWEMDLNKMMEAIPENFVKGTDPFKEMGKEQPDLFLCNAIPKKHTNRFGISEDFSSVVFQMSQLVDKGMKNRINAERERLKKLPHVVRLLNIAGYKSLDDKIKYIRKKVKAGPENTREWHVLAMDLFDLGNVMIDSVANLNFSDNPKKNKKKDKSLKKLRSFTKKMLEKVRAKLGYHGNLNEKQWKGLVNTMLKESGNLVKLLRALGITDAYVPPRNIDFNKIPDSYHSKVKKAIEILEALTKSSKPNLKRWERLQKRMAELSGRVKNTVNMEAAMGKKRKRCAQSPESIGVASLGMMQETRGSVGSEDPDYYSEVPQIARPLPYHCSWIDPENGRGSSVVLAAKELEGRVKAHIEAMAQRLGAYDYAGQAAGITEAKNAYRKRRLKTIASGSKRGDEIMSEWMEILENLVVLRQDLEKTASAELRIALNLRRCNVPVTALKQAVKRNDKGEVYRGLLKKLDCVSEGLQVDGAYVTVISAQSKNEAKNMAYRSAISTFAGREIKRAIPRKSKDGKYQFIVFKDTLVIVKKLEMVEMANGHAMCGIVARLATSDEKKTIKPVKPLSKKSKKGKKRSSP